MLAVLVMVALVGAASADFPAIGSNTATGANYVDYTYPAYANDYQYSNVSFNFEQSVQGTGYFMTYVKAKVGNLAFKNYQHGSGSIDQEAILQTYDLNRTTHNSNAAWNDFDQTCIQFKETVNSMTYAPMKIAVGTGYYAANPLAYNSLLKERTEIKNYRAATSMINEIEYAHAIPRKDILIIAKENFNRTWDPEWQGDAVTSFKINEEVTDGKIHIGVLQGSRDNGAGLPVNFVNGNSVGFRGAAWYKPSIEVDEDYFGTYNIQKNMTIEVPYYRKEASDDWLPCCSGGWSTMPIYTKTGFGASTKGIFDCSCYKVPTQAEFPEAPTKA